MCIRDRYEAVRAVEPFADSCLKRYLGRIMKCRTVEELRSAKDGVTPDCYSYSNFIFRHLKKRDYTVGACIGSKVSRARQQDYEVDAQHLKKELEEAKRMADGLKAVREMESLKAVSYTHLGESGYDRGDRGKKSRFRCDCRRGLCGFRGCEPVSYTHLPQINTYEEDLLMDKKFGIKHVVAMGIGTALFVVLTNVQIPVGFIPNTALQTRAAVLAFFSAISVSYTHLCIHECCDGNCRKKASGEENSPGGDAVLPGAGSDD